MSSEHQSPHHLPSCSGLPNTQDLRFALLQDLPYPLLSPWEQETMEMWEQLGSPLLQVDRASFRGLGKGLGHFAYPVQIFSDLGGTLVVFAGDSDGITRGCVGGVFAEHQGGGWAG